MVRIIRGGLLPVRGRKLHHLAASLRHEIVLGIKMSVEATMRQVCRFHDVGDADAVKTLFPKQRARRIDNAFAMLGGFLPAHSHDGAPLLCLWRRDLTIYMMIDINTQVNMTAII
jgi:hypothetical protein